jgi:hypothetical protein
LVAAGFTLHGHRLNRYTEKGKRGRDGGRTVGFSTPRRGRNKPARGHAPGPGR